MVAILVAMALYVFGVALLLLYGFQDQDGGHALLGYAIGLMIFGAAVGMIGSLTDVDDERRE